jgi:hypothetical protein
MNLKRSVVSIAMGERYAPLLVRQIQSMRDVADLSGATVFFNEFPPGAPRNLTAPMAAYCAKPFAMRWALQQGFELLLWLDSACYITGKLDPVWEHIAEHGYYVQDNGWKLGQWSSDAALKTFGITRDEALEIPEISTMAMGLDMRRPECQSFVDDWANMAADGATFHGAHTNDVGNAAELKVNYRSVGHVSDDPRCLGHRHDQSAAAYLAHLRGWTRTPRPIFADYFTLTPDPRTIIVNKGGI